MEKSKLMTPLFYGGNFNREGRRMRAVLEKEISDGLQTYRLWRTAGKPDLEYPRAGNDKYILHVEINGYLVPLGLTDYKSDQHLRFRACGPEAVWRQGKARGMDRCPPGLCQNTAHPPQGVGTARIPTGSL